VSAPALARLEIADAQTASAIAARSPALDDGQSGGQTLRIVGWSLAAICSIVLVTLYGIPLIADRLTPLVPMALEERMGDGVDRQLRTLLGAEICTGKDGQAALDTMMGKLIKAGGYSGPLRVQVLSSQIPNAFAAPGGRLYLLDGLLQRARNADEVAGVMAHELGHAHHRDGLRRVIQTGGTSFLIGLLFGDITGGGAVVFAARSILNASHSREAETRADDFAIDSMQALGRSPQPLGDLLVRMTGGGKLATIVDSHPLSAERLARMKDKAGVAQGAPIISDAEWQALKRICADKTPGKARDKAL
jgi:predicted Zn-dependent protease